MPNPLGIELIQTFRKVNRLRQRGSSPVFLALLLYLLAVHVDGDIAGGQGLQYFLVLPRPRLAHDNYWFRSLSVEDVGELDAAVEEAEAATAVCDLPATIGAAGEKIEGELAVGAGCRLRWDEDGVASFLQ